MGLDMYACATETQPDQATDFETDEGRSFYYWRKHPNLHGLIRTLYLDKGGNNPDFNCTPVQIDADDLDWLEQAIKENNLPSTSGFFFGESDGTEKDDDLMFVAKAREEINQGNHVFYYAWW